MYNLVARPFNYLEKILEKLGESVSKTTIVHLVKLIATKKKMNKR